MSDINLFLAENENFKIVTVTFPGSTKTYHYKTMFDVKPEDSVVVDTPSEGLKIVQVQDVIPGQECELNFNFNIKWLVQVINLEGYEEAKAMERQVAKALNKLRYTKRRQELLANLAEEVGDDGIQAIKGLVRL